LTLAIFLAGVAPGLTFAPPTLSLWLLAALMSLEGVASRLSLANLCHGLPRHHFMKTCLVSQ
jgi:hypothetical protein